jgi:hypothetical protein
MDRVGDNNMYVLGWVVCVLSVYTYLYFKVSL